MLAIVEKRPSTRRRGGAHARRTDRLAGGRSRPVAGSIRGAAHTAGRSNPSALLVHVVEREEVHRELLERLHALASLLVTLEGVTVFNASRLECDAALLPVRSVAVAHAEKNACGEGGWVAFWACNWPPLSAVRRRGIRPGGDGQGGTNEDADAG